MVIVVQPEKRRQRGLLRYLSICVAVTGIGLAIYFIDVIQKNRESAHQTQCRGRLSALCLALHNYHDAHGSFPPAYLVDESGKPMHSWRVLILPYLGSDDTYRQYRFDESWNGPHNAELAKRASIPHFHCPGHDDGHDLSLTDYVVIVGRETAFPNQFTTTLGDLRDGPENTILIAEVNRSDIHWMEPRDLVADQMSYHVNDPNRPSISSPHGAGPAVLFADTVTAFRLDPTLSPGTLKALTTINGRETVSRDKLVQRDSRPPHFLGE